jgi:diacylglycerol kinase (ATP)
VSRDVVLVVNPVAGRGRALRLLEPVRARLADDGHSVRVVAETGVEATQEAVQSALASSIGGVVALGGDGLVHLLAQQLAQTDVPLGIVPAGTGNDFAAELGIPADPLAAAALIAECRPHLVDAVHTGERWWTSVLCAGFDSSINERANDIRWPRGPARYNLAILAELAALRAIDTVVTVDGQRWVGPSTLVAIGNTGQYGGGYRMCAGARPDDGLLDVVIVGQVGRADLVRMLPKVRSGRHLSHRAVTRMQGRDVTIEAPGIVAYADGERVGPLPVASKCVPGALRVWRPDPS